MNDYMRYPIALLRFINVLLVTSFWGLLAITILRLVPQKHMPYITRIWARTTLRVCGIRIEKIGQFNPFIEENRMVVSNHISWIDVLVIQSTYATCFIGKAEMKKWPVLGSMIKKGGTIFINRSKKRQLLHINQIVQNKLEQGASIGLFPEGRTGDGKHILPFKTPILEATIIAKSRITPVVLEYVDHNQQRTSQVTYAGHISLYRSVLNTLLLKRIHVKIYSLPQVHADEYSRRDELSAYLFNQISTKYNSTLNNGTDYDNYIKCEPIPSYGELNECKSTK